VKVYKVILMVIDHDEIGLSGIEDALENARYPNRCIMPRVMDSDVRDIGEWSDENPLNSIKKADTVFNELFSKPQGATLGGHECVECFQPDCDCNGADEKHCNMCSECREGE
jgi:hypothetical protein